MNTASRILLPFIVVLLMTACAPPPVLRNDRYLHDDSLLSDEPCAPPCWRGITPGETEWRDALSMLEDEDGLAVDPAQEDPDSDAIGVQWKETEGDVCCQMVSVDGGTVTQIVLQTAPDVTVGEMIEARGEPTYAVGNTVTDDQAFVSLIYPDVPMVVLAFVAGAEAEIRESSEIIIISYMTPENMDLAIQTTSLHAWEGFQPYSTYAADADASEFEVTPSITLTPGGQ